MGCNDTLTDDQLEVMFTVTDEEMRHIGQIDGMFDRKNQTKMQEVYQILL